MAAWIDQIMKNPRRVAMPIMTHPGIEYIGKHVVDAVTNGEVHFEAIKAVVEKYAKLGTSPHKEVFSKESTYKSNQDVIRDKMMEEQKKQRA